MCSYTSHSRSSFSVRFYDLLISDFLPPFPKYDFGFRISRFITRLWSATVRVSLQYYEGSDFCLCSLHRQISPFTSHLLPIVLSPNIPQSISLGLIVTSPGILIFRLRQATESSPLMSYRNAFVILQTDSSPPVALHPTSR